jgi:predicted signal transduction protein with EAL and GGDEF domain
MSAPFDLAEHQVTVGVSIGIAVSPASAGDGDQLIKQADIALYRAKAEGGDCYKFFEAEMDKRMRARRLLEVDLRAALASDELAVYYQPLVNLERDEICGLEALLRWNHPARGNVPPSQFIPLAEETGLVIPIGEWVLRRACMDAAAWPDHLKLAVNFSPAQFKSRFLLQTVISALSQSGLDACRLELEITESVTLQDAEASFATLRHLRALGITIALDDFGTGYSSLSNLRKSNFDKIKIDRSFVRDLSGADANAIALVRSIAQLAKSLGIITTAEGIETEEQLNCVRAEGYSEAQGYYLYRPMPALEIERLLPKHHSEADAA